MEIQSAKWKVECVIFDICQALSSTPVCFTQDGLHQRWDHVSLRSCVPESVGGMLAGAGGREGHIARKCGRTGTNRSRVRPWPRSFSISDIRPSEFPGGRCLWKKGPLAPRRVSGVLLSAKRDLQWNVTAQYVGRGRRAQYWRTAIFSHLDNCDLHLATVY